MVEHNLAKVGVASSNLVFRSRVKVLKASFIGGFFAFMARVSEDLKQESLTG